MTAKLSRWQTIVVEELLKTLPHGAKITPEFLPTTPEGWRELAILAEIGPMQTPVYRRWAKAMLSTT